jgi:hypothetical protein
MELLFIGAGLRLDYQRAMALATDQSQISEKVKMWGGGRSSDGWAGFTVFARIS